MYSEQETETFAVYFCLTRIYRRPKRTYKNTFHDWGVKKP